MKEKRSDVSSDYFISNYHTKRALDDICNDYVPNKVHKVLPLVEACDAEKPTTKEFEENIYEAYVDLLDRLKQYEGGDVSIFYKNLTRALHVTHYFCLRFPTHFHSIQIDVSAK